eukprot:gene12561-12692_t
MYFTSPGVKWWIASQGQDRTVLTVGRDTDPDALARRIASCISLKGRCRVLVAGGLAALNALTAVARADVLLKTNERALVMHVQYMSKVDPDQQMLGNVVWFYQLTILNARRSTKAPLTSTFPVQDLQPCPAVPHPPPNSLLLLLHRQQRPVQLPAGNHQLLLADGGSDGGQLRDAVVARVTTGLGCGADFVVSVVWKTLKQPAEQQMKAGDQQAYKLLVFSAELGRVSQGYVPPHAAAAAIAEGRERMRSLQQGGASQQLLQRQRDAI